MESQPEESITRSAAFSLELELPAVKVERLALRAGDLCPRCGQEKLDYDGCLNLACPRCGYALGGCFT